MAGLDGNGPLGQGPMTGRGLGNCNGGAGRGFFGRIGGMGRGLGRGLGRGFRSMRGFASFNNTSNISKNEEKELLKKDIEDLEDYLSSAKKRLSNLDEDK